MDSMSLTEKKDMDFSTAWMIKNPIACCNRGTCFALRSRDLDFAQISKERARCVLYKKPQDGT